MALLAKLLEDNPNPFGRRMLAEDTVEIAEVDDSTAGSIDAGLDNQLDDTELADVTEIDQTEPTEQLEAVDNVSDADQGSQGDDSNTDDFPEDSSDSDSGTSLMTWIMYIGGAILVLALLAGVCFLISQRKDAQGFEHDQQNTEMTHHDHTGI